MKEKRIKVLGICGSPLPDGNTARLIRKVLEGAQSAGAETEFISLAGKRLSFCTSCYLCVKHGECIIDDDLKEIRKIMMESDGLVIGSPTYNLEVTGQMKTFFDRLWYDVHREAFLGKHSVYVNTHNFMAGHASKTLRNLSLALGYSVVGSVVSGNLEKFQGKIDGDLKSQRKAFEMGLKLVQSIQDNKRYISQELMRKLFIRPVLKRMDRIISDIPV